MKHTYQRAIFITKKCAGLLLLIGLFIAPAVFFVTRSLRTLELNSLTTLCQSQAHILSASLHDRLESSLRRLREDQLVPEMVLRWGWTKSESLWRLTQEQINSEQMKSLGLTVAQVVRAQNPSDLTTISPRLSLARAALPLQDIWSMTWSDPLNKKKNFVYINVQEWLEPVKLSSCRLAVLSIDGKSLNENPLLSYQDFVEDTTANNITGSTLDVWIQAEADSHVVEARVFRWQKSFFWLGAGIWLLLLLLLAPQWWQEWNSSVALSTSIEEISQGRLNSRPRLFLNNHLGHIEQAIEKLGSSLPAMLRSWRVQKKIKAQATGIPVHNIVVLTVQLTALSRSAKTPQQIPIQFDLIFKNFSLYVSKHEGTIDVLSADRMTAVWGYYTQTDLDAANATMAALDLSVFAKTNPQLSQLPIGIGIDEGPAQFAISETDEWQELIALGLVCEQSFELARLSQALKENVLITESVATRIENYFVVSPVNQDHTKFQAGKLYRVLGYVDAQQRPVLIEKKS